MRILFLLLLILLAASVSGESITGYFTQIEDLNPENSGPNEPIESSRTSENYLHLVEHRTTDERGYPYTEKNVFSTHDPLVNVYAHWQTYRYVSTDVITKIEGQELTYEARSHVFCLFSCSPAHFHVSHWGLISGRELACHPGHYDVYLYKDTVDDAHLQATDSFELYESPAIIPIGVEVDGRNVIFKADPNGTPREGVEITLYDSDHGPAVDQGSTNSEGKLVMSGLEEKLYSWEARYDGEVVDNGCFEVEYGNYSDLAVNDILFEHGLGEERIIATIQNAGKVDEVEVDVLISVKNLITTTTVVIENRTIYNFKSSNITQIMVNWVPLLEHTIIVHVDPYDKIEELDETNNRKEANFTGFIDLVIGPGDASYPETFVEGNNVTINVTIHNSGNKDAEYVWVVFSADNLSSIFTYIETIPYSSEVTISFNWTVESTNQSYREIIIKADPDNIIPETNEDNNEVIIVFQTVKPYIYIWVPFSNWSDQTAFEEKARTRADFFVDISPLRECPEVVKNIYVNLDWVRNNCGPGSGFDVTGGSYSWNQLVDYTNYCGDLYNQTHNLSGYEKLVGLGVQDLCIGCAGVGRFYEKPAYGDLFWDNTERLEEPAHELGHTYGICDEHTYSRWDYQNRRYTCPNPWNATHSDNHSPCPTTDDDYCCGIYSRCCGAYSFKNYSGIYHVNGTICDDGNTTFSVMGYGSSEHRCGYGYESYQYLSNSLTCT